MNRCGGKTSNGSRCKRNINGSVYCYQHNHSNGNNMNQDGNMNQDQNLDENKDQEKSLYERLGGIFAIAAVVNLFSDELVKNAIVGTNSKNPYLREWARSQSQSRLPGLKWMRTLWVADITGGPYKFVPTRPGSTPLGLENAHRNLRISPDEFDEVARILALSLDYYKVPVKEKNEVLTAFMAHKPEVTLGFREDLNY